MADLLVSVSIYRLIWINSNGINGLEWDKKEGSLSWTRPCLNVGQHPVVRPVITELVQLAPQCNDSSRSEARADAGGCWMEHVVRLRCAARPKANRDSSPLQQRCGHPSSKLQLSAVPSEREKLCIRRIAC